MSNDRDIFGKVADKAAEGVEEFKAEATKSKPKTGKQWTLMLAVISITVVNILVDYVTTSFSYEIFTNADYWIKLALTQCMLVALVLLSRSYRKDVEIKINEFLSKISDKIGELYLDIINKSHIGLFKRYVDAEGRRRQKSAYLKVLHLKLKKCKNEKKRAELLKCIVDADKEEDFPNRVGVTPVKYHKISVSMLFGNMCVKGESDENFSSEEGKDIANLISRRIVLIICIGVLPYLFMPEATEFAVGYLIKTFLKIAQIVLAISTGMSSGEQFIAGNMVEKMSNRRDFIQRFFELEAAGKVEEFIAANSVKTELEDKHVEATAA